MYRYADAGKEKITGVCYSLNARWRISRRKLNSGLDARTHFTTRGVQQPKENQSMHLPVASERYQQEIVFHFDMTGDWCN